MAQNESHKQEHVGEKNEKLHMIPVIAPFSNTSTVKKSLWPWDDVLHECLCNLIDKLL